MRATLLAIGAACLAAASTPAPGGHDGKIDYIHDTAFGLAKAKMEGKVAMLFFTADW